MKYKHTKLLSSRGDVFRMSAYPTPGFTVVDVESDDASWGNRSLRCDASWQGKVVEVGVGRWENVD